MVEKNKHYDIEITGVSSDGNGVCKVDGFTVFVPMTVTGDKGEIVIVKVLSKYAIGRMLDITTPSPIRQDPKCPVFKRCGGCHLQHIKYENQLEIKSGFIEDAMQRIGGFENLKCDEVIGMENPYRYRNKCIFPVGIDKNGEIVSGFYASRSHDIIAIDDCMAGVLENEQIVKAVKEYMAETGVMPYNEENHTGLVRRVFIRDGRASGEIMVVVSVNGKNIPQKEKLVSKLAAVSDKIVSIYINVNETRTNNVLGMENKLIYGKAEIEDTLLGIKFKISPHSFYQINPYMTEKLYGKALEYANITDKDNVLDVYCGIGTISLAAAKSAKHVTGIEIVEQAVRDAKSNAKNNGISNVDFFADSAENAVPKLIEGGMKPDIVILDPPRKGSDEATLRAIAKAQPKRIVYVSCNASTLARDAKYLSSLGYTPTAVTGVDMFPNTCHVETVVLLSQLKPDDIVQVELNAEDLALTSAEAKATYEEIKTYVKRAFGFKVSSLYIAQVKQKMGLPMGKNYNVSKKGTRVPICPPEKEAAILEALKHYKMI